MSEKQIARVNAIVATFADVEPGTTHGYPAFKWRDKTFAWFPKKKEVPEGTLGVRVSIMEREYLIAHNPKIYFFTPHYRDYDAVLANPSLMSDGELRDLLESGYEFIVKSKKRRK